MKLWRIFVFSGLCLAGCATSERPRIALAPDEAVLAPSVTLTIPPPKVLARATTASQIVVAHFRRVNYTFQAQIALMPDSLKLVALDAMGRRALTVTWTQAGIDYQTAPWLPARLRPADILGGIALVYWPDEALRGALRSSGAELNSTEQKRVVKAHGQDIVVVDYESGTGWNRAAHLRNLAFGYSLDIQSAEVAP
jgi:hypothetical protein